jgi:hypothetical protein
MAPSSESVRLSPADVLEIEKMLSDLRHNINNHLSLIAAAVELVRCRPDTIERMTKSIEEQPARIQQELRHFSERLSRLVRPPTA